MSEDRRASLIEFVRDTTHSPIAILGHVVAFAEQVYHDRPEMLRVVEKIDKAIREAIADEMAANEAEQQRLREQAESGQ